MPTSGGAFRAKYTGQKVADIRASIEAVERAQTADLAGESTWTPEAPPAPNAAPLRGNAQTSAAQHRFSKALFAELGVTDDADRHAYYEQVCGYDAAGEPIDTWAKVVAAGKASTLIDSLKADLAAREEQRLLEAALPRAGE